MQCEGSVEQLLSSICRQSRLTICASKQPYNLDRLGIRYLYAKIIHLVLPRSKRDSNFEVFVEMTLLDIEQKYSSTEAGRCTVC